MRTDVRSYFAPDQSLYDDMEMPRGICVNIVSVAKLHDWFFPVTVAVMASGKSDDGDIKKAKAACREDAKLKLPLMTDALWERIRRSRVR